MDMTVFQHVHRQKYQSTKYALNVNLLVWHAQTFLRIAHLVYPILIHKYFWTITTVLKHVQIIHTPIKQQLNVNPVNLHAWNVPVWAVVYLVSMVNFYWGALVTTYVLMGTSVSIKSVNHVVLLVWLAKSLQTDVCHVKIIFTFTTPPLHHAFKTVSLLIFIPIQFFKSVLVVNLHVLLAQPHQQHVRAVLN